MRIPVLCFLLVCVSAGGGAAAAPERSCVAVHDFYRLRNITADDSYTAESGPICGGSCCSRRRESDLAQHSRHELATRAHRAAKPLTHLLLNTARTLHEHVTEVSRQSQNKTRVLLAQVYRAQSAQARAPLARLYSAVRDHLHVNHSHDELAPPPATDIERATTDFFRDIFPLAYLKVVKLEGKDFSEPYKSCLRDAYGVLQPFGEVPRKVASSLARSIESTRVLLQALALGARVLDDSEKLLARAAPPGCDKALLRMSDCARCKGDLNTKPCQGLCLNVVRGCLSVGSGELDGAWAGYVEGVERLVRADAARALDAAAALRALDQRLSEAIMYMLETSVLQENKVKRECGSFEAVEAPIPSELSEASVGRREPFRVSPPNTELLQFAATLAENKRLFATLADKLCRDENIVETNHSAHCWNGDGIGEYTKNIAEASPALQKYNPEVALETMTEDTMIIALADRLRHARQLLIGQVAASSPTSENFMQSDMAGGDEAEGEGSGSGRERWSDDDASFDAEGSGEGSGHTIEESTVGGESTVKKVDPPHTGAASALRPRQLLSASVVVMAALLRWNYT